MDSASERPFLSAVHSSVAEEFTRLFLDLVQRLGYAGVFGALFLEGCWFPIMSEVVLLAAGYLAFQGQLSVTGVALAAAVGFASGSLLPYLVARTKGRGFVVRHSRHVGVSERAISLAERWFARHGLWLLAPARLFPVIRAAVSVPAGLAPVPPGPYVLATFGGYLPWGYLVVEAGRRLGAHWDALTDLVGRLDQVFLALAFLLALAVWLLLRLLSRAE